MIALPLTFTVLLGFLVSQSLEPIPIPNSELCGQCSCWGCHWSWGRYQFQRSVQQSSPQIPAEWKGIREIRGRVKLLVKNGIYQDSSIYIYILLLKILCMYISISVFIVYILCIYTRNICICNKYVYILCHIRTSIYTHIVRERKKFDSKSNPKFWPSQMNPQVSHCWPP